MPWNSSEFNVLDLVGFNAITLRARALFIIGYLIKCSSLVFRPRERQREYRSNHDFQERPFARADDEIELRYCAADDLPDFQRRPISS